VRKIHPSQKNSNWNMGSRSTKDDYVFVTTYGSYYHRHTACVDLIRAKSRSRKSPLVLHRLPARSLTSEQLPCVRCYIDKDHTRQKQARHFRKLSVQTPACKRKIELGRAMATTRYRSGGLYRWRLTTRLAKRRGIAVSLTDQLALSLLSKPCLYCGHQSTARTSGLDRVDNAAPYEPDNVVGPLLSLSSSFFLLCASALCPSPFFLLPFSFSHFSFSFCRSFSVVLSLSFFLFRSFSVVLSFFPSPPIPPGLEFVLLAPPLAVRFIKRIWQDA